MNKRLSIRLTVISLFILTTCLTASVAIGLQYYFSKQKALTDALDRYQSIVNTIGAEVHEIDKVVTTLTKLLSGLGSDFEQFDENTIARNSFARLMSDDSLFYSLYIAREDGHFYQLINLNVLKDLRTNLDALPSDRWVVVEINQVNQQNIKTTSYYDSNFQLRENITIESKYDATLRPWFLGASEKSIYKTDPYLFHNVQVNGQTYSSKMANSKFGSVLGIDIVVETLSDKVKQRLGTTRATKLLAQFFIYDDTGALKASSQDGKLSQLPTVTPATLTPEQVDLITSTGNIEISSQTDWPPLDFSVRGKPAGYFVDIMRVVSLKTGINFKFINGYSWSSLVNSYKVGDIDILYPVGNNATNRALGELSAPVTNFDFGFAALDRSAVDFESLVKRRLGVLKGWSIINELKQVYPDIQIVELDDLYTGLQWLQNDKLDAIIDLKVILDSTVKQHFFKDVFTYKIDAEQLGGTNSFHFVAHNIDPKLIHIIDQTIAELTDAELGFIENKWLSNDGPTGVAPYKFLLDATEDASLRDRLSRFEANGVNFLGFVQKVDLFDREDEFLSIVVPEETLLKAALENVVTATIGSAAVLALLIPLARLFSSPIVNPILALIRQTKKVRDHDYVGVERVPSRIKEIDQLSESIKTTANNLASYEKQQQEFVDSFIKLIAQAIDDKSPYTAGHCNRVPELAIMLVDKAEEVNEGSLADFCFASDAERREFRIGAWLHDCGKITTPEHIVDKGSKLEANYNRIHEIRTRFEVLIRDHIIAFYQKQTPQIEPEQDQALQAEIELLKQEFAEVANTNIGGEFMDDAAVDRIQEISKRTWTRYLDDRLGLSPEELRRLELKGIVSVTPATEFLLADKAEHLYKHLSAVEYDPSYKIKMKAPEYLANRGEIYNLTVRKGTLTAEDRFKINEHIIGTIKMLEGMPFPDDLSKVPRYASTHHETMKGTGYPRQLKGEDLSIPERIMALADIFEALTAADRPYKNAKTLSESLRIMKFMVLDEHLDKEVYRLFLSSKTYLAYAEQYLEPEQIDEIDIDEYWV